VYLKLDVTDTVKEELKESLNTIANGKEEEIILVDRF